MESHRGVWVGPGTSPDGGTIVQVVDSHGWRLLNGVIPRLADAAVFREALLRFLDMVDPVSSVVTAAAFPPHVRRVQGLERDGRPQLHVLG